MRRKQRRAGAAVAFAISVAATVAVVLGVVDGGSPLRPPDAAGREVWQTPVVPPLPIPHLHSAREASVVKVVDRVRRRTPLVVVAGRRHREVALTFDDGPGPYSLALVHVLKRLRVPATFFQVGTMVPLFPAAERAIARDHSFVVGDHTETHAQLTRLTVEQQRSQIDAQASQLYARRIPYPHLFRPPYGLYDADTLRLLASRHMLMVLWTVDSEDYTRPGAAAIARRVLEHAKPGAIVLMHDAGGDRSQTIAALPAIVHGLRRRHFHLVTIPRLLHDAPPSSHQPRRPPGSPV